MAEKLISFQGDNAEPSEGRVLRVFSLRNDAEAKKELAKKQHDVTSALRSLRFAVEALQKGYRFNDDMAAMKIASMDKAITNLEKEATLLEELLMGQKVKPS